MDKKGIRAAATVIIIAAIVILLGILTGNIYIGSEEIRFAQVPVGVKDTGVDPGGNAGGGNTGCEKICSPHPIFGWSEFNGCAPNSDEGQYPDFEPICGLVCKGIDIRTGQIASTLGTHCWHVECECGPFLP